MIVTVAEQKKKKENRGEGKRKRVGGRERENVFIFMVRNDISFVRGGNNISEQLCNR